MVNSVINYLYDQLHNILPGDTVVWASWINTGVVAIIITIIFGFIFKTLPDGKLGWKETLVGSGFTAILFMIGKWGIGLYLGNSDKMDLYGAAGSILIILVWVYYSAIILYFGAVFTKTIQKCTARLYNQTVIPCV